MSAGSAFGQISPRTDLDLNEKLRYIVHCIAEFAVIICGDHHEDKYAQAAGEFY